MSNSKGLMTLGELGALIGPLWRRAFTPFHSSRARIEAATQGNPILNWRANYTLYHREGEDFSEFLSAFHIALLIGCTPLIFGSVAMPYAGICMGSWFFVNMGASLCRKWIWRKIKLPVCHLAAQHLLVDKADKSGIPILDALMTLDPFETEHALLEGGLTEQDILRISQLLMPKQSRFMNGRISMDDLSPREVAIMDKAAAIVGIHGDNGNSHRMAIEADPLQALGYAGLDIHARGATHA